MLRTKDLHATMKFYMTHLGFICEALSEADGWASLRQGPVELMVAAPNSHMPFDEPAFTGSFYFNVDDAAALWAKLKKDVVKVCYPIEDFHYGMREFAIYDNNGYLLQFGSPLG